jgi:exodeoxyribonuclease-5
LIGEITPSDVQWQAIQAIRAWYREPGHPQVFYLAGYAGTGKSTIVAHAIKELRLSKVETATYTGKAASVLRKKGVDAARTIHSLIYMPEEDEATGEVTFVLAWEGDAADAQLIVLDECSMVDEEMARDVLSFGKKVLVMGDPGQLPPINGPGFFQAMEPDFFLEEVHRQAMDSPILRLATIARQGKPLPLGAWDDSQGFRSAVLPHTADNQSNLYRPETQPLCGTHRVRWGYTGRIRRKLGLEGIMPLKGEPVICCRNNRDAGVLNGQFGQLLLNPEALDDGVHWNLSVQMEDQRFPLDGIAAHPWLFQQHYDTAIEKPRRVYRGIHEFDYGYVITCHKAQGSEWPDVTIVDDGRVFRENQHKWRYTAITRASERVTFLRRM